MKQIQKQRFISILAYVLPVALCLISSGASCRIENGRFTLHVEAQTPPELERFVPTGSQTASLCFSREITFTELECRKAEKNPSNETILAEVSKTSEKDGDGNNSEKKACYTLHFAQALSAGQAYVLSGAVKDGGGNTLTFSIDFIGYNEHVPHAVFSEAGPVHANSKDAKKAKAEFVELYILEDGNIGGMVIQSAYDGTSADFVLPAVQVKKGDYISAHMRIFGETAVSETGNDLTLSTTIYSNPKSRDLWAEKAERSKTKLGADDVLLLLDRPDGNILDALLYCRSEKTSWAKPLMNAYAQHAFKSGVWQNGFSPKEAVCSDGITAVKTLSRTNIDSIARSFNQNKTVPASAAEDWKVLSGKGKEKASPGSKNRFNE